MGLLLVVVVVALFAPLLSPYSPTQVHFDTPFQRVGTEGFWLGTDDLGRDIMSRTFYGTRASLEVGVLSVALAIVIGVPLGLVSGYWRWLDSVVSRLTDLMLAFPFLIIAVGLAAINGASLANAAIALGIAQIPTMIRVIRAETLRWKEADFIRSARAFDAGSVRILGAHILPNAASAIIVQATVIMPVAIIGEATLSFLGLGITPPNPSLGIMLSDAQQYIFRSPAAAIIPGLAIVVICLGFNFFGDALRDALDPTTSSRR
jgi:peptide/nickel transport system permease protein